jgi:O-acetylserine/cysteine efflux transporter
MNTSRRTAIAALAAAGLLWGTTVPLTKVALAALAPGWLTFTRFGLAAAVLLVAARRRGLRAAFTPAVLVGGAAGYGGSVLVQNAGIARTSVTHAALLIGAAPVLVAIIAAVWYRALARPVAWLGFGVSLLGIGLVTVGQGGGASVTGDGLVIVSVLLSATFTAAQSRLLRGRDPVAVTAVAFVGAALAALPFSLIAEGLPSVPASEGPALAVLGLVAGGTLLPFTLFAFGQSRISPELASAFLNLEPLVGAVAGAVLFGDPAGPAQIAGGVAILGGIALSSLPLLTRRRPRPSPELGRNRSLPAAHLRTSAPIGRWPGHRRAVPSRAVRQVLPWSGDRRAVPSRTAERLPAAGTGTADAPAQAVAMARPAARPATSRRSRVLGSGLASMERRAMPTRRLALRAGASARRPGAGLRRSRRPGPPHRRGGRRSRPASRDR